MQAQFTGNDGDAIVLSTSGNSGGDVATWLWTLSGGSGTLTYTTASPSVTLANPQPAAYTGCTVRGTNAGGFSEKTFSLLVHNAPPVLSNVLPASCDEDVATAFTASWTGPSPLEWDWDFTGGASPSSSSAASPSITWANDGSKTGCTVRARNDGGWGPTVTFTVTVNNVP